MVSTTHHLARDLQRDLSHAIAILRLIDYCSDLPPEVHSQVQQATRIVRTAATRATTLRKAVTQPPAERATERIA